MVTICKRTVSHLLTVIRGDDCGVFGGRGICVVYLRWKRLFPMIDAMWEW